MANATLSATLSDFQKKKVIKVFSTFFDINNDGIIEWEDFEICVRKVRDMHAWGDGEKYQTAMATVKIIWEGLKNFADENQDNKISQDEWLRMWQQWIMTPGDKTDLPDWQQCYMIFMFEVNDTSGDKMIDVDEYTAVYTNYGLSEDECRSCFSKFAVAGDVDIALFKELWVEYFTSNDPSDKGNFIFGNPDNF